MTAASPDGYGFGHILGDSRWLRNTLLLAMVAAVVTGAISLVWPKSYRSEAKILPNPSAGASSSLIGLAAASGFGDLLSSGLGNSENPVLTYPEILSSRWLQERIVITAYPPGSRRSVGNALDVEGSDRKSVDRAVRVLTSVTQIAANLRSGIVSLSAVTRDSVLSAFIVQQMLTELDRFNLDSRSSRGRATREFVEGRLDEARRELASGEQSLAMFRKTNIRIGNSPQLLLEQARLEREVDTRSELFRLLARQYEMARIEEKRDTPTFTVVDPPKPPVRKYRPNTTVNALLAFLAVIGIRFLATQIGTRRPNLAVAPQAATLG